MHSRLVLQPSLTPEQLEHLLSTTPRCEEQKQMKPQKEQQFFFQCSFTSVHATQAGRVAAPESPSMPHCCWHKVESTVEDKILLGI